MSDEQDARYDLIPVNLRPIFQHLEYDVVTLFERWKMYCQLYRGSEFRIKLLNRIAPTFFADLQEFLFDDVVLGICRLTDPAEQKKHENCVLHQLSARLDQGDYHELRQELATRCEQLVQDVDALRKRRDKLIAHRDLKTATLSPVGGIAPKIIDDALKEIAAIMNKFRLQFIESICIYEGTVSQGNAGSLLYQLCLANECSEMMRTNPELAARVRLSPYMNV